MGKSVFTLLQLNISPYSYHLFRPDLQKLPTYAHNDKTKYSPPINSFLNKLAK